MCGTVERVGVVWDDEEKEGAVGFRAQAIMKGRWYLRAYSCSIFKLVKRPKHKVYHTPQLARFSLGLHILDSLSVPGYP